MTSPSTDQTPATSRGLGSYGWYLTGQWSWFASFGLQMVLFPWLAAVILAEGPVRVGLAQTAILAPSLLFMVYGGVFADQRDTRRLLIIIHAIAGVAPIVLALVMWSGNMSYAALICFGLFMGTLTAFAMPARDSLLSHVAAGSLQGNLQRAVTLAALMQFVGQLSGNAAAMMGALLGAPALLLLQGVTLAAGGLAVARLEPAPPHERPKTSILTDMGEGLMEVLRSPVLLPVTAAMFGVGIFYVGNFLVLLPLIVRDVFGGTDAQVGIHISIVNFCFGGGTIAAILTMLRIGHVERRGLVLLCALCGGVIVLALMSVEAPFWVLCILCALWGMAAGTSMTMSRTMVQTAALPSHRARILAIFQLGFAGGGPIGSMAAGFLVEWLGPRHAALPPAAGMTLLLLVLLFASKVVHIRAPAEHRV